MLTAQLTPTQMLYMTKFTREGQRDMKNKKPYRTKAQKAQAKRLARKGKDGTFHSSAPVSFHIS